MLGPSPTTMVETESYKIVATVDTGATTNFISLNILNNLDKSKDNFKVKTFKEKNYSKYCKW